MATPAGLSTAPRLVLYGALLCLLLLPATSDAGTSRHSGGAAVACAGAGADDWPGSAPAVPPTDDPPLRAGVLTVTGTTDDLDGDWSSPAALKSSPGADGTISLREALAALSRLPSPFTVNFAAGLLGQTINLSSALPHLGAAHVTIDGDIAGNHKPGVTIHGSTEFGLFVEATDVRVNAIGLSGFTLGVRISPSTSGQTYQDQVFTRLQVSGSRGLELWSNWLNDDHWQGLQVLDSTLATPDGGIGIAASNTTGDSISNVTIARNQITLNGPSTIPFGINIASGGGRVSSGDEISGVIVADNDVTVQDTGYGMPLRFAVGDLGGQASRMEHVTISGNRLRLRTMFPNGVPTLGMMLQTGDSPDTLTPPFYYPSGNLLNDVSVLANSITGPAGATLGPQQGIMVVPGVNGATDNHVTALTIAGNSISAGLSKNGAPMGAIQLMGGGGNDYSGVRATSGNSLEGASVSYNTISMTSTREYFAESQAAFGGLAVYGGGNGAESDVASGIVADHNLITTGVDPGTPAATAAPSGVTLLGGLGGNGYATAGNQVAAVTLTCNVIPTGPTPDPYYSGLKGISLIGGAGPATGNSVAAPLLAGNQVAGVLDDQSRVRDVSPYASLNTVGPAPNPAGLGPARGPEAGGTSVTIAGTDFTGGAGSCAINLLAVRFGPHAATVVACGDSSITVITPPRGTAPYSVDVLVTTAGGPAARALKFGYHVERIPAPPGPVATPTPRSPPNPAPSASPTGRRPP